mmetsp:Transcript_34339/g.134753  ORF Transcript_34339/g.134753 Transcript_34339/m.134753 type:complete len:206 (+) Transcript_34339:663-1280(+)
MNKRWPRSVMLLKVTLRHRRLWMIWPLQPILAKLWRRKTRGWRISLRRERLLVLQEVRVSSLVWLYVCANLSCFHRFLSQVDAGELDPVTALGDDDTEDVVLVQTEFVWPEGAARDVKLCGDWNNFLPIQMYSEGVSGFWSVVTPVPIGDHEFKFIVDGVWRVSKVHPLAGEGGNEVNFRSVKGIPRSLPSVSFPGLGRPRRYFS